MLEQPVWIMVYGTLKRRHGNHGVLGKSRYIGDALTVENHFTMFDGGFPWVSEGFQDSDRTGRVVGELYEVVSKDVLQNLDRLEGVPYMYLRRETDVVTLDGSTFPALMYVASDGSNERLKERSPMEPIGRDRHLEWK